MRPFRGSPGRGKVREYLSCVSALSGISARPVRPDGEATGTAGTLTRKPQPKPRSRRSRRTSSPAVRLLVLTGCRKSEILTLEWRFYREGRLYLLDSQSVSVLLGTADAAEARPFDKLRAGPSIRGFAAT